MTSVVSKCRLYTFMRRNCAYKYPSNVLRRSGIHGGKELFGNLHYNMRQFLEPRYVVHFGNILAVCAMMQSEMLYLRCFMIGASICGITFNLLQPVPLIIPAYWGLFFVLGHSIQIYFLIRDKLPVSMSDDLQQVYEQAFSPYGFTARQYLDLCEFADYSFIRFKKGEYISTEGSNMPYLHWLLKGKVVINKKTLGDFGVMDSEVGDDSTRWLGEFFDPNRDKSYWDPQKQHKWIVSHQCVSECHLLRLDRKKLDVFLNRNDSFKEKASKVMVKDLWNKIRNAHAQRQSYIMGTYRGMLNVAALTNDHSELSHQIQNYLEKYANSHTIDKTDIDAYLQQHYQMSYEDLFRCEHIESQSMRHKESGETPNNKQDMISDCSYEISPI
eukprot:104174_1